MAVARGEAGFWPLKAILVLGRPGTGWNQKTIQKKSSRSNSVTNDYPPKFFLNLNPLSGVLLTHIFSINEHLLLQSTVHRSERYKLQIKSINQYKGGRTS